MTNSRITIFTKPWPGLPLEALADLVAGLGAEGIELPVRDGYQVNPDNVASRLSKARRVCEARGLAISSVAGALHETTVAAMGDEGIRLLRVCVDIDMSVGYFRSVENTRERIRALEPVLRSAGVSVGIQNHAGHSVGSALGIYHLLEPLPREIATAVLDFAHCALDGEPVDMALSIVKSRLGLVNFKNAFRQRISGSDEPEAIWETVWSTGRQGAYSWREAVSQLRSIRYDGDLCLPAEYSRIGEPGQLMGKDVVPRLALDIAYLKDLLGTS